MKKCWTMLKKMRYYQLLVNAAVCSSPRRHTVQENGICLRLKKTNSTSKIRDVRPGPVRNDRASSRQFSFHTAYPTPPTVKGANTGAMSAKASILLAPDAMVRICDQDLALTLRRLRLREI